MKAAILAVVAAALCFSTTGTARALAGVDASPVAVGAARILIGGLLLAVVAWRPFRRPGTRRVTAWSRTSVTLVGIGAAGVLGYQPCFFLGTELNGVAIGTVVALGSAPVLTGVCDSLLRRRPPSRRWLLATGLAIFGMVLIAGLVSPSQLGSVNPLGVLASIGAGACYAVYTLASKALLDRSWDAASTMGAIFGLAGGLSLPLLLASGTAWLATPNGLLLAGWLGVVTTALAYLLFGWGLARLPATTVSTLTLAEPLAATLLGLLVLHEQLTGVVAVGLIMIAAGLVVLALPSRKTAGVPATS